MTNNTAAKYINKDILEYWQLDENTIIIKTLNVVFFEM